MSQTETKQLLGYENKSADHPIQSTPNPQKLNDSLQEPQINIEYN